MGFSKKQFLTLLSVVFLCSSCNGEKTKTVDLCEPVIRQFLEAKNTSEVYDILKNHVNEAQGYQKCNIEVPEGLSNPFVIYDTDKEFSNPYYFFPDYGDHTLAVPGKTYYYRIYSLSGNDEDKLYSYDHDFIKTIPTESQIVKEGSFKTMDGGVRFLNVYKLRNIRDLGGWKTVDGKTVKYNMLYRGPAADELTKIATLELGGQLGIKTEIDLRHGTSLSASNFAQNFLYAGIDQYDLINPSRIGYQSYNKQSIKDIFHVLGDETKYPVYYHCAVGCDRTGTLSFLINGLLGVDLESLTRDFELSSFSIYGYRCRGPLKEPYLYGKFQDDNQNYINWGSFVTMVKSVDDTGTLSLKECVKKFLMEKYEVLESDIDSLQNIMLED